ncbi:MAG TPA: hypothetical protein VGN26_18815 [Armatimonadota bacterium]
MTGWLVVAVPELRHRGWRILAVPVLWLPLVLLSPLLIAGGAYPAGPAAAPPVSQAPPGEPEDAASSSQAKDLYRFAAGHLKAGKWTSRAVTQLERAISLDPNQAAFHESLGCAYLARFTETLMGEDFGKPLGPGVTVPGGPLMASRAAAGAKDVESARKELERAVALAPSEARYHHSLGWYYALWVQLLGTDETPDKAAMTLRNAYTQLTQAVSLSPKDPAYLSSLADLVRLTDGRQPAPDEKGHPIVIPDAWDLYTRAAVLRGAPAGLHHLLAVHYTDQEGSRSTRATEELHLARAADPGNALYPYLLACLQEQQAAGTDDKSAKSPLLDASYRLLGEANRCPKLVLRPYVPAFPALLAPTLTKVMLLVESMPLFAKLRGLARGLVGYGRELEDGSPSTAFAVYREVATLGQRLAGDPRDFGTVGNDTLLDKLVGIAVTRIATKPTTALATKLGDQRWLQWAKTLDQQMDGLRDTMKGMVAPAEGTEPAPPASPAARQ